MSGFLVVVITRWNLLL